MASQTNLTEELSKRHALTFSAVLQVLTDPEDDQFRLSMLRWTEIELQTPAAILQPSTEDDIQKIVKCALRNSIPFVIKSGGNSSWSTIGSKGWIIDLSLLQTITLNATDKVATIQSGVLTKKLNVALSEINFYLPTPTGGSVAFIPFMLGGGSSPLSGMYGLAIDSLLSARVVTASGDIVVASEDENPDLLWALKGAGQFFGIVTEVRMRMYDIEDPITTTILFFLPQQIDMVAQVLEKMVNGELSAQSSGMAAILAPPGKTDPMIMVSLTHFRPLSEIDAIIQPLLSLKPINQIRKTNPWSNITDSGEGLSKAGGYKTQVTCGLQRFSAAQFVSLLTVWKKLVTGNPSANGSLFMYTFYSTDGVKKQAEESSAWSHRDIGIWAMMWLVAPDMKTHSASVASAEEYVTGVQKDQKPSQRALFPNHTRTGDVEQRYRGGERLKRLRALKKIWDPEGLFSHEFL